jgi:hypothetical protein
MLVCSNHGRAPEQPVLLRQQCKPSDDCVMNTTAVLLQLACGSGYILYDLGYASPCNKKNDLENKKRAEAPCEPENSTASERQPAVLPS